MADPTHVVHRNLGRYRRGQVVNPSGWKWRRLLEDNEWITKVGNRPTYPAADGTVWITAAQAEKYGGGTASGEMEPTPESDQPAEPEVYEFTPAAEAVVHGAGFELEDYDGAATGATGNVLKSDAEAWVEAQ